MINTQRCLLAASIPKKGYRDVFVIEAFDKLGTEINTFDIETDKFVNSLKSN